MTKKIFFVIFFLLFISISGCATIEEVGKGAGRGFVKDTKDVGHAIWIGVEKADAWVQKNLW